MTESRPSLATVELSVLLPAVMAAVRAGALLGALHGRDAVGSRWVRPVRACCPLNGRASQP